uniref:Uncharacterized protein n=1 Tax=Heterorhabditis bacteriophora TaxID=37862 RepID=A0A1I7W6N8_HETBA
MDLIKKLKTLVSVEKADITLSYCYYLYYIHILLHTYSTESDVGSNSNNLFCFHVIFIMLNMYNSLALFKSGSYLYYEIGKRGPETKTGRGTTGIAQLKQLPTTLFNQQSNYTTKIIKPFNKHSPFTTSWSYIYIYDLL